jgi:membrane protease YdiL (CAAX protease family)
VTRRHHKYPTHEDRERTDRDTPALILTVTLLAAYNITRTLWIPESWQLLSNIGMALVVGAIAWWSSVDATELGLHRDHHARGAIWGGAALLLVMGVVVGFALISEIRGSSQGALDDSRLRVPFVDMLYEIAVNTPLGTVILEEFAFRGLLLALFLRHTTIWLSVLWSSLLFGAWHILPTLTTAASNDAMEQLASTPAGLILVVIGNVLSTAVAGAVFAYLRLRSGSLLAPALAHLATNDISFVVGWLFNRFG